MTLDRRVVLGGAGGLIGLPPAPSVWAKPTFPSRPLTLVAPANPGGGADQLARVVQQVFQKEGLSPRPLEVINRGGAGGAIGLAEVVSRHRGNPHMAIVGAAGMISAMVAQDSPFNFTDAEPLARLLVDSLVVATPANSRFAHIDQLLKAFRDDPSGVTWCGGSAGGLDHALVGLIGQALGVPASELRYVAYSGGGAASAALLGGQVDVGVNGFADWLSLATEGRIRILAATRRESVGGQTIAALSDIGIPADLMDWRGLFAPPGLEEEHLAWWTSTLRRMEATPTWRALKLQNGWGEGYLEREAFRKVVADDRRRDAQVLAGLGIGGTSGGYSRIGPYTIPAVVGAAGAVAVAAAVAERVRSPGGAVAPTGSEDDDEGGGPLPLWGRLVLGVGLLLAYLAALAVVGFLVSTPVFIFVLCILMRSRSRRWDALMALGLTGAVWLLFSKVLHVTLP